MADVPSVLVAYATEHESTGGVAERIAARLRERGARVDVRSVVDVDDVGGYDAVVSAAVSTTRAGSRVRRSSCEATPPCWPPGEFGCSASGRSATRIVGSAG